MNSFDELRAECADCRACALSETRTQAVFGVGNPTAKVMFIGEAPGFYEDEKGEPFVGRSGKLLDEMLAKAGFSRHENIFIANIVKCRPPENRDPSPAEVEACKSFIRRQIALIKPKVIVCLGRIAAYTAIGSDFKVTRDHGVWHEKKAFWLMGTFHPAAVLRNMNLREAVENDIMSIHDHL